MPGIQVAVQVVEAQVEVVVEEPQPQPQRSSAETPNRFNSIYWLSFLFTSLAIFILYSNLGTRN